MVQKDIKPLAVKLIDDKVQHLKGVESYEIGIYRRVNARGGDPCQGIWANRESYRVKP